MLDRETISNAPMLPNAECIELVERWQRSRDRVAMGKISRSYYRMAVSIAKKYHRANGHFFDDAVQEGMIGLMRAADKFDPSRKVLFCTYADYWVRAFILRFLRDKLSLVHVSHTKASRQAWNQLPRATKALHEQRLPVTSSTLASEMGVPEEAVDRVLQMKKIPLTLGDGDGGRGSIDITLEDEPTPEGAAIEEEESGLSRELIQRFEKSLSGRELAIFARRMLADPEDRPTLQELGDEMGVSRERIRQIESRLMKRLKALVLGKDVLDRAA